ncbi:MAG: GAF domain-containing protein [Candidatus Rokuibacteriota bacterium]
MMALHPSAATPLLLLMGVVTSVGVHQIFLWFGRRREPLHPWVVAWCANTLLMLSSHYLQQGASTPEWAGLAGRLAWMSSLFLIVVMIGLSHALAGRPMPGPLLVGIVGADLALLALVWLGEHVVKGGVYLRTDRLGAQYWAPEPGPFMTALVPCFLLVFAYCVATVWRSRTLAARERRAVLAGFAVYLIFAVNDVLHAARVIESVRVFAYAFVAVAVGLHYLLVARFNRVSADLEGAVADQTRALETRQEALAALLRAERAVMSELDLKSMLEVIVTEASRIAGTPYVKVLLLDEERQILRVAAVAGGVVRVGVELPLGHSYSGTVATTGEVLFSSDTQNDPKNFLAAQDRAAGVVSYLGLPIKAKGRVLGVLTLNTETSRDFGEEEIACLASFADRAALALEHVRLRDDLEERLYRTDTLAALNRLITSSLDLDRILEEIARAAARLMNADLVILFTANDARQALEARAISPPGRWDDYPARVIGFDEGVVGAAIRARRTIHVPDLDADPRARAAGWFREKGLRSGVAVPILHGDTAIGALAIASKTVFAGSPEHDTLLQSFVDQAAIAITHARLYAAGQARIQRLHTVTRLNRLVSSSLDLDHVLHEITVAAAQLAGTAAACFWVASQDTRTLRLATFSDETLRADWPAPSLPFDVGVLGWVARYGRVVNVPDVFTDGRFVALGWWRDHGLKSFLGLPVMLDGVLLGILALNGREPYRLDAEDERLLDAFVDQAAVAIRNASLFEAEGSARRAAEHALAEVKALRGLLPICSYCKKVRNDENYWEQIESYICQHSDAQFSHSICPECRDGVVKDELARWRGSL